MIRKAAARFANRLAYGAPPEARTHEFADLSLTTIDGTPVNLADLAGRVLMFVNVASRCGLTPQYDGLVKLQETYRDRGFTIIGVPCNQFLGQEPGNADQIKQFCSVTYGVDFPILQKQHVNGAERSSLYQWLIASEAGGGNDIAWNFEKFLVGRDAQVVARFTPRTAPEDPTVVSAIEAALGA